MVDNAAMVSLQFPNPRSSLVALCLLGLACGDSTADTVGGAGGQGGTSPSDTSSSSSTTDGGGGSTTTDGGGGSGTGAATPVGCYDYNAFTPATVSFADDVMPLFAARCASCHMDTAGTYYGSDAALVFDKLLNATPVQAPQLRFVQPNDPLHSYMLAKVEYPNPGGTCSEVQCSAPGCELFAPPGQMLTEAEKGILRSWVMTGAEND